MKNEYVSLEAKETLISDILNDLYGMGYEIDVLTLVFGMPKGAIEEIVGIK